MPLELEALTEEDADVLAAARDVLKAADTQTHRVGAAVRGKSGKVYVGLHLPSRQFHLCAEAVAIGAAAVHDDLPVNLVAAMLSPTDSSMPDRVVSPCGSCRELINEYAPEAFVVLEDQSTLGKTQIRRLFPFGGM